TIADNVLFDKAAIHVSLTSLDRRAIFAKIKPGWYDAGAPWQEVCSHVPMIVGLCDLIRLDGDKVSKEEWERLLGQLAAGIDYLGQCQDKAAENGQGIGPLVHDLPNAPEMVTPNDLFMGALAFAKAA